MKNKIVTIVCILAIVMTTVIAAAGSDESLIISQENQENVTVTNLLNDGAFPKGDYTKDVLYPMTENYGENATSKEVKVKNNSNSTPLYIRTIFYFEAGNLSAEDYFGQNNKMYIKFNDTNWEYSSWSEAYLDGKKFYTITATYADTTDAITLAPGDITSASLEKIGLKSTVSSSDAAGFGEEFEMKVVSQGATVIGDFN